jgi:hypothetical protein
MRSGARRVAGLLAGIAFATLMPPVAAQRAPPVRVVDRVAGVEVPFDALLAEVGQADVLLLGAMAGAGTTVRIPAQLFQALSDRRGTVTIALEALERDMQEPFDHFQMGHMSGAEFLGTTRPGPGYDGAQQALVGLAIAREWPMVAAGVPRRIANTVAVAGLEALDALTETDRRLVAADHACAGGRLVARTQPDQPHAGAAWCLDNETIAESIAQAYAAGAIGGRRPLVIAVVVGDRIGHLAPLPGDVVRRLPGRSVATLGVVPAAALATLNPVANGLALPRFVIADVSAP